MRRAVSQAVFVAMIAMVAACGTARVIQRTQAGGNAGGTIELEGDRNKAMEQANEEMAAHCGPNHFTIVQDGEEEIDASGGREGGKEFVTLTRVIVWVSLGVTALALLVGLVTSISWAVR